MLVKSAAKMTTPYLYSVAPMMEWTDVPYRQLARLLTRKTYLYTEMVVDKTLTYNPDKLDRFLWMPPGQNPVVLQLGGNDPRYLAEASQLARPYNYDEINLNCGCPSDKVAGAGCFGAVLMKNAETVSDCMRALQENVDVPVTVKCRLGVDDYNSYEFLHQFIDTVASNSDVRHFIIHTRKAILTGISPAKNRSIPPLRHSWVWALKRDFPNLSFTLNGGVSNSSEALALLSTEVEGQKIDGVMVGRAAYNQPWQTLADADRALYGEANPARSRRQVAWEYAKQCDALQERGYTLRSLVKPLMNIFSGERNGRTFRNEVETYCKGNDTTRTMTDLLNTTLHLLSDDILDTPPYAPPISDTFSIAGGPKCPVLGASDQRC